MLPFLAWLAVARRLDLFALMGELLPWFIKPLLHLRATGLRHMHLTASRVGATRASHSAHAVGDLMNQKSPPWRALFLAREALASKH